MPLMFRARHPRVGILGVAAALLCPSLVTLIAAPPVGISTTTAALAYVLAVIAAAAVGGVWPGLAASVLSFLALNFFFTPPVHTLTVSKTQDLVALAVFLAVSAAVGTLLSRVLVQRSRAEQREREARLLQHLGTRLLSGTPTEEVLASLARSLTDLFGLQRCEITTELAASPVEVSAAREGQPDRTEVEPMIVRDREVGRIVLVPSRTRPLGGDERNVIRTLASQTALAIEGMRLASEAREARVDSETSRLRAALFSSVTHDLRTPLASITASVTSLLDSESNLVDGDRDELLETIRQEAERLNRVVGNLLDLSRMRAGALTPATVDAAVDEIAEGVVGRLAPLLHAHDVRLILRDDVPEIPLDVVQIDQAITNVLENAARFTPPGKQISVAVGPWRGGVEIRIADQGPGIPEGERDRVFEPFVRGEGSTGTGLGLAITKAIVEAHGGDIRVTDAPGGGTAVVMHLPGSVG